MTSATQTRFTDALALRLPIVQAPMGGVSGPKLVASAVDAGALGVLPIWFAPREVALELIGATRTLTVQPFAVNLRADLVQLDHIAAAADAGVSLFHLFWGDPTPCMSPIRAAGARMLATVWDADSTKRALDAGACALIAQGVEAGGHVKGTTPLAELLPEVVELAGEVPVAAAGGLADGGDIAWAMACGADAAVLGTRFAATVESDAHEQYKQALLRARGDATVRSTCFDGMWPDAPHRTLRNTTFEAWDAAGRPEAGSRPGEGDVILRDAAGQAYPRYSMMVPTQRMSGDWEAAALYAGTGVTRITDLPTVRQLIEALV